MREENRRKSAKDGRSFVENGYRVVSIPPVDPGKALEILGGDVVREPALALGVATVAHGRRTLVPAITSILSEKA